MRIISGLLYSVALCLLTSNYRVAAQIETDGTLSVNSDVIKNGINFKINGGTVRGNNLFHSFKQFNILTGGEAFFNNASNIKNIFTRVTGNSISNIDGIIKANGSANLFLINPNGIVFGNNARLNIGGSFIGTSASSINFADDTSFNAATPQEKPLLTISVPAGLQFGQNSQPIIVNSQAQLEVKPGNTLALIGGDIKIDGGILKSPQGNIELGSVDAGIVDINFPERTPGFTLNYENIQFFKDIQLQQALIDASGFSGNYIQLQGRNITVNDGARVLIQNFGFQKAGDIKINATESLQVWGISPDKTVNTSLINQTFAGDGGDITVSSKRLEVQDGAIIETRTYGTGKSGNLNIRSHESVQVKGVSQFNPSFVSGINAATFAQGNTGDVVLSTANLSIEDGANVSSLTLGTGNGGDVIVNASTLELIGYSLIANKPSLLSASSVNAGNAGSLKINTSKLNISGGANANASTLANGDGGNIIINASESIKIDGSFEQFGFPIRSNINSSATVLPEQVRLLLNLPSLPSGVSGDVTIHTPNLSITNGGQVSVTNQGVGDAGRLYINANFLKLDRQSSLAAATAVGKGGNILLETRDLQLRNNSTITATARGSGNGGNIEINTDTLLALENSDITANAEDNFGGKVIINAQGVFGIQERKELTSFSDITASSGLGASFNGVVQLNTPGIDPNSAVVDLPMNAIDPSNQISAGCDNKVTTLR